MSKEKSHDFYKLLQNNSYVEIGKQMIYNKENDDEKHMRMCYDCFILCCFMVLSML